MISITKTRIASFLNRKVDMVSSFEDLVYKLKSWDFPGSPVGKTLRSQCRRPGSGN